MDTQFLQNHDNVIENSSLVVTSERKTCMSVDYRCEETSVVISVHDPSHFFEDHIYHDSSI